MRLFKNDYAQKSGTKMVSKNVLSCLLYFIHYTEYLVTSLLIYSAVYRLYNFQYSTSKLNAIKRRLSMPSKYENSKKGLNIIEVRKTGKALEVSIPTFAKTLDQSSKACTSLNIHWSKP